MSCSRIAGSPPALACRRNHRLIRRHLGALVGSVVALLGSQGVEVSGMTDIWSYRDTAREQTTDVVGFDVVATDGSIGKVDEATYDRWRQLRRGGHRTVDLRQEADTARRVIERIDYDGRQVFVNLTKDQIRDAPDYDTTRDQDETYPQRPRQLLRALLVALSRTSPRPG
jgi:hypothetical protein